MTIARRLQHVVAQIEHLMLEEAHARGHDTRFQCLHHQICMIQIAIAATAREIEHIETHMLVPKSARAGLSVVEASNG